MRSKLKKIHLWGVVVIFLIIGCKNPKNLETAFKLKGRREEYRDTVSLLKTKGDIIAGEINDKLRLYAEKPLGNSDCPDPDEIIQLQNALLQLQMKKIREQDDYVNSLEGIVVDLVDPKREVFVND